MCVRAGSGESRRGERGVVSVGDVGGEGEVLLQRDRETERQRDRDGTHLWVGPCFAQSREAVCRREQACTNQLVETVHGQCCEGSI